MNKFHGLKLNLYRFLLLVISSGMILPVSARKYTGKLLKDKADSTLTALLNERIIHQNIVYKGGEYTYVDWAGDITYAQLYSTAKIEGTPKIFYLHYIFNLPEYKSFNENIEVVIDSNLKISSVSNLDFIPAYVINNLPANLITELEIKRIAEAEFTQKGIDTTNVYLSYNHNTAKHIWQARRLIQKSVNNEADYEYVNIDALSGEILDKGRFSTYLEK